VLCRAFATGLLVRVTGDIIALSPPLIISEAEIDELVEKLRGAIAGCAGDGGAHAADEIAGRTAPTAAAMSTATAD